MAAGCGFTVTTVLLVQPIPIVRTMVAVPAVRPVTTPVEGSTETVGSVLPHVPVNGVLLSVIVAFSQTHIGDGPVITEGNA
jgi:hypothetical protein